MLETVVLSDVLYLRWDLQYSIETQKKKVKYTEITNEDNAADECVFQVPKT